MKTVYLGKYYVKGFGPTALYTVEHSDGAGVYYGLWRSAGLSGMSKLDAKAKFDEEDLNREDVPAYVGDYVRQALRAAGYGRVCKDGGDRPKTNAERKRESRQKSIPVIPLTDSPDILEYLKDKDKARTVKAALREYMERHKE